jgi:hypothetical protein
MPVLCPLVSDHLNISGNKKIQLVVVIPSIVAIYTFKFEHGNNNGGATPDGFVGKSWADEIIFFQSEKNA